VDLRIAKPDRLGDQEPLGLQSGAGQAKGHPLVEDLLVQGVLVHDGQAVLGLDHDIGVVDLDEPLGRGDDLVHHGRHGPGIPAGRLVRVAHGPPPAGPVRGQEVRHRIHHALVSHTRPGGRAGPLRRHGMGEPDRHTQVLCQEPLPQCGQDLGMDPIRFIEPHLDLGRVHVHVKGLRGHGEEQEDRRLAVRLQQPAIGLLDRMADGLVPDEASVEEHVLEPGVGPGHLGSAQQTQDLHAPLAGPDLHERLARLARQGGKQGQDPVPQALVRRQPVHLPAVVDQGQVHSGSRAGRVHPTDPQCYAGELLGHVVHLSGGRAEELLPCGQAVEEVPYVDGRAHVAAARGHGLLAAAVDLEAVGLGAVCGAAHGPDLRNSPDAGQGLAPETEGRDGPQVVVGLQLARGMGLKGQGQVLGVHALPIVGDAGELAPALLHGHGDPGRAPVQGILQELLDHTGRALDHLAGGNRVDQVLVQDRNARHGSP